MKLDSDTRDFYDQCAIAAMKELLSEYKPTLRKYLDTHNEDLVQSIYDLVSVASNKIAREMTSARIGEQNYLLDELQN